MQIRKITKEEVNELPLLRYEGECQVINRAEDVKAAIDHLSQYKVVGFDTETKPAFKKGQFYPVALLQLAVDDRVFLFRLLETGLTQEMISLFENPQIVIAGIGIRDDIKDLQKLKPFKANKFVDLNEYAKKLHFESIGARNLSGMFLKGRISKSQQVSNWENSELTEAQVNYAATDAWICVDIYNQLHAMERKG